MTTTNTSVASSPPRKGGHATAQLGFDPYVRWLEITEPSRPLNAYQILELELFESRVVKIQGSYDRQRMRLRKLGPGPENEVWLAIDQELQAAIHNLTDQETTPLYRAQVRRELAARPMPPTDQSTRIVNCACGNTVPVGGSFCTACGKSAWKGCPGCETVNASSERFCAKCGCDVADVERQLVEGTRLRLDEARSKLESNHFDAAQTDFRDIAMVTDFRLAEIADEARSLLNSVVNQKSQLEKRRDVACEKAETALENGDHVAALDALSGIPAAVQDERYQAAFHRADSRSGEIASIERLIVRLLETKNVAKLGEQLQQLHLLVPEHPKCQSLAIDLKGKFMLSAQRRIQAGRYQSALTALKAVPLFVRDEAWEKLDKAARLHDLVVSEFDGCHILTKQWLGVAKKISESMPKNELLAEKVQAMQQQLTQAGAGSIFPSRDVKQTRLQFLNSLLGIKIREAAAESFAQSPGQYTVAAGAALTHFEGGEGVNLAPKRKSRSVFRKKAGNQVIGLDIGHARAKWVCLEQNEQVELIDCGAVDLTAEKDEERIDEAIESFRPFFAERSSVPVAISIPTNVTMLRTLSVPLVDDKKLASAMELEMPRQFPVDLEELYWNYATSPVGYEALKQTVHCGAVRRRHVDIYLERLKPLKANIQYVQDEAWTIGNLMRVGLKSQLGEESEKLQWLALHVGATSTHLVHYSPKGLKTKTVPFGARAVNKALTGSFKLTDDQADLVRREPSRSNNPVKLISQFDGVLSGLVSDIKRTLDMWERETGDRVDISACFLSGGAMLTACVANRIASTLRLDN